MRQTCMHSSFQGLCLFSSLQPLFSALSQLWTDSTTGVLWGKFFYVQSIYLKMTALHLQMRVQQEYLISMHTVADVHKYV